MAGLFDVGRLSGSVTVESGGSDRVAMVVVVSSIEIK